MKTRHSILLVLFLMSISFVAVSAETEMEFGISGGYSDNLFFDSTRIGDLYTSPYLAVNLYPTASLELTASGSYINYGTTGDLESGQLGAGVTYIDYSDDNPLSYMLSGEVSTRRYGNLYAPYDYVHGGVSLAMRYGLHDGISMKAGAAGILNKYVNSAVGNNRGYGLYGGINAALPGANSIDIESGYDVTQFPDLFPEVTGRTAISISDMIDIQDRLETFYYSIRISRPLASHSGLSLEYAARHFVGDDDVVTYGLSVDNLSPWMAFWEGQAVSARIKSFVIPHVIVSTSLEYRDIAFMDALESDIRTYIGEYGVRSRDDEQFRFNLSIRRPISTSGNGLITPSLDLSAIDNNSNHPLYKYASLNLRFNLNLQF
jgi:hypothetical protein